MATSTLTLTGVTPLTDRAVGGFTVQVEFCGAPEHETLTVPLKPPSGVICNSYTAVCPGGMVTLGKSYSRAIEKSAPWPVRTAV